MQILTFIGLVGSALFMNVNVNLCEEYRTFDGYLICSIHDIQGSNKVNVNQTDN